MGKITIYNFSLEVIIIYSYRVEKKHKFRNILIFLIAMILVSFFSIKIYNIYLGIEVKSYGTTQDTPSIKEENNNDTNDTPQILENATRNVVGISKIKNNGSTIFSTKTNEEQ